MAKSKLHPLAKQLGFKSNKDFYAQYPTKEAYEMACGGGVPHRLNYGGNLPQAQDGISKIPEYNSFISDSRMKTYNDSLSAYNQSQDAWNANKAGATSMGPTGAVDAGVVYNPNPATTSLPDYSEQGNKPIGYRYTMRAPEGRRNVTSKIPMYAKPTYPTPIPQTASFSGTSGSGPRALGQGGGFTEGFPYIQTDQEFFSPGFYNTYNPNNGSSLQYGGLPMAQIGQAGVAKSRLYDRALQKIEDDLKHPERWEGDKDMTNEDGSYKFCIDCINVDYSNRDDVEDVTRLIEEGKTGLPHYSADAYAAALKNFKEQPIVSNEAYGGSYTKMMKGGTPGTFGEGHPFSTQPTFAQFRSYGRPTIPLPIAQDGVAGAPQPIYGSNQYSDNLITGFETPGSASVTINKHSSYPAVPAPAFIDNGINAFVGRGRPASGGRRGGKIKYKPSTGLPSGPSNYFQGGGPAEFNQGMDYYRNKMNTFLGDLRNTAFSATEQDMSNQHMMPDGSMMSNDQMKKGGIYIKPSKRGTFTAAANKRGKSVQGFASQVMANKDNYSSAMVKKANFAKNAAGWKKQEGGEQEQIMQLIQAYAQIIGANPEELVAQLQELPEEKQQEAIQQMVEEVQRAQGEATAQPGMDPGMQQGMQQDMEPGMEQGMEPEMAQYGGPSINGEAANKLGMFTGAYDQATKNADFWGAAGNLAGAIPYAKDGTEVKEPFKSYATEAEYKADLYDQMRKYYAGVNQPQNYGNYRNSGNYNGYFPANLAPTFKLKNVNTYINGAPSAGGYMKNSPNAALYNNFKQFYGDDKAWGHVTKKPRLFGNRYDYDFGVNVDRPTSFARNPREARREAKAALPKPKTGADYHERDKFNTSLWERLGHNFKKHKNLAPSDFEKKWERDNPEQRYGGAQYQEGGEYDMNDEEIQRLIDGGYNLEYID